MKAIPRTLFAACLVASALGCLWGAGIASAGPVKMPTATVGPHGTGSSLGNSPSRQAASLAPGSDGEASSVRYSKRRLLVRFKPGTSKSERIGVRQEVDGRLITAYTIVPRLQLLRIPADTDMAEARQELADDPNIAYAIPDLIAQLAKTPNDPEIRDLWGMEAIKAPQAWSVGTGSRDVVVGVVDSGADYNHPDLRDNIWTNPGEIPANGKDDDGNGYIDDVHGIDPLAQDSDPMDENGHGTHVAGTIGAAGNNAIGVAGVNWRVALMPLKICGEDSSCSYAAALEAMQYAIANGASVTNHSWGGQQEPFPPFTEAVEAARQADQLFVAAAGNDATNSDKVPFNPAGTPVDNVISVGATGPSGALASFSNYGTESVDIAAPGEWILSTLPGSVYGNLSGTSMASPHVAGAAALLKSVNPSWSYSKLKEALLSSVTPDCSLAGKAGTTGLLNLGAAVTGNAPIPKLCVSFSGSGTGSVTAQGTDLICKPAFCEAALPSSGGVVLNASSADASTFAGWSGACRGTSESCTVAGSITKSVGARFDLTSSGPPGYSGRRIALPPENEIYQSFERWQGTGTVFDLSANGNTRVIGLNHAPFRGGGCFWDNAANDRLVVQREVGGVWQQEAAIRTPFIGEDPRWRVANCDGFGEYIALSGDGERLFVGIGTEWVGADSNGVERYQCAVYLYERSAGWDRTAILKPPGVGENGAPERQSCQEFGFAFAVDHRGERIAVRTAAPSESNGALVFVERSGQWVQEATVELPETGCHAGKPVPDSISMSADGRHLVLGNWDSPGWNPDACKTAGYWVRTDGQWQLRQAIERPEARDAPPSHDFGMALSISADGRTLTISSTQSDDNSPWEGAAWVYERPGSTWQKRARLSSQKPELYGIFRCPTMNSDGSRILCTTRESVGFNQSAGRLYVFDAGEGWGTRVNAGNWLIDPQGESGDLLGKGGYGSGLAMDHSGTTLLVPKSPVNVRTGLYPDMHLGMAWTAPEPSAGPRLIGSVPPSAARGESILVRGYGLDQVQEFRIGGSPVDEAEVLDGSLVRLKIPQGASSGQITAQLSGSAGNRTTFEPVRLDTSPTSSVESPSLAAIPGESPNVARFEFTSPTADSFVCRLDDSAWEACSSPYATSPALELGTHLLSVRAVTGGANSISSSLAFTTTPVVAPPPPPEPPKALAPPTIKSGPAKKTTAKTARFTFSGEAGGTFQCRLNSGAWASCTSPTTYRKLRPGSHTFRVRQVDGQRSSKPATYSWRVIKKK